MEEKLKNILHKIFKIPVSDIDFDFNYEDIEEWDSLRHVVLVLQLEKSFGIKFAKNEIIELISFENILRIVSEKKQNDDRIL